MELIKAHNIGFCNGVNCAIKIVSNLLETNEKIYCLGKLVNNNVVMKKLAGKGLIIIDRIEDAPDNSTVIIRAHGESIETYKKAEEKKVKIVDLTCGNVKIIHNKVSKRAKDCLIIIIGKENHPEIIGTKSFACSNSIVISKKENVNMIYELYNQKKLKKIYICSQTTFSLNKFNLIISEIQKKFSKADIIIDNTICKATINRQEETKKISQNVDEMVIVGDKFSSNTKELYNIAKPYCKKALLVSNEQDLKNFDFGEKIGIVSGTSTSIESVDKVIDLITNNKFIVQNCQK